MGIFDKVAAQFGIGAQAGAVFNPKTYRQAQVLGNIIPEALGLLGLAPLPGTSPFNIDKFRSNLGAHGELAKVDKFDVLIQLPQMLQNLGGSAEDLSLQCEAAELPGRDIGMIEYRHYGFTRRIPHMNQYGQASFTFYVMGDLWEKKMFDSWMELMVPSNRDGDIAGLVSYPETPLGAPRYHTNILVNQYNNTGQLAYQVQLNECIPISVAPLATNWATDDMHRMTVNFAFTNWVTLDIAQTGHGGGLTGAINNFSNQLSSLLPFGPKIGLSIFN